MTIEVKIRDDEARIWRGYLQSRYKTRTKDLEKLIKKAVRREVAAEATKNLKELENQ